MKFDPNSTINQGRWRLRDPNDFERMWTVKTKSPGVTYIAGYLKENRKFGVQAIRFDKKLWTEKEAAKWWNERKDKYIKTWQESDWKKKQKITRRKALYIAKKLVENLNLTYINPSKVSIDSVWQKNVGIPVGSLRQGKKEVGDIDIVITKNISKEKIKKLLKLHTITGGEKRIDFTYDDVNINVFVFTDKQTWGAALLHSSGPYIYNVRLRNKVKKENENWKLSQNGFIKDNKIVKTPTERSLQIALGVSERKPNQRA
jgi:DNA polymerase/3'-5' exonuclease PolX